MIKKLSNVFNLTSYFIRVQDRRITKLERELDDVTEGLTSDMVAVFDKIDALIDATVALEEASNQLKAEITDVQKAFRDVRETLDRIEKHQ